MSDIVTIYTLLTAPGPHYVEQCITDTGYEIQILCKSENPLSVLYDNDELESLEEAELIAGFYNLYPFLHWCDISEDVERLAPIWENIKQRKLGKFPSEFPVQSQPIAYYKVIQHREGRIARFECDTLTGVQKTIAQQEILDILPELIQVSEGEHYTYSNARTTYAIIHTYR